MPSATDTLINFYGCKPLSTSVVQHSYTFICESFSKFLGSLLSPSKEQVFETVANNLIGPTAHSTSRHIETSVQLQRALLKEL